jgi:hypothetical protein
MVPKSSVRLAGLGVVAVGTVAFLVTYAPVVAEKIAPVRFPVYAADKLERVERLQANRWDASLPATTPRHQNARSLMALAESRTIIAGYAD